MYIAKENKNKEVVEIRFQSHAMLHIFVCLFRPPLIPVFTKLSSDTRHTLPCFLVGSLHVSLILFAISFILLGKLSCWNEKHAEIVFEVVASPSINRPKVSSASFNTSFMVFSYCPFLCSLSLSLFT